MPTLYDTVVTLAYFLSPADSDSSHESSSNSHIAERDAEWLAAIAKDDEAAFKDLYTTYYPSLFTFAKTLLHHHLSPEEVVHDVFISLWNRRSALHITNVRAYLFRAVRLRSIDAIRTSKAAAHADHEAMVQNIVAVAGATLSSTNDPDAQVIAAEIRAAIEQAIAAMPRGRAIAARLRWVDGLAVTEVAQVMDISVSAAQMQVLRAKEAIADVLRRFL